MTYLVSVRDRFNVSVHVLFTYNNKVRWLKSPPNNTLSCIDYPIETLQNLDNGREVRGSCPRTMETTNLCWVDHLEGLHFETNLIINCDDL